MTLIDEIKKLDGVVDVRLRTSVELVDGRVLHEYLIYTEQKPPDLGVHVSDGMAVKLESGNG